MFRIRNCAFIIVFSLIGCDKNDFLQSNVESKELDVLSEFPKIQEPKVPFSCDIHSVSPKDPFHCVKLACDNVRGQFLESKKECQCPDDRPFSALNGGECSEWEIGPEVEQGSSYSTFNGDTFLHLRFANIKSKLQFENDMDKVENFSVKAWQWSLLSHMIAIIGETNFPKDVVKKTLAQFLVPEMDILGFIKIPEIFYYEPDQRNLPYALGWDETGDRSIGVPSIPELTPKKENAISAYNLFRDGDFTPTTVNSSGSNGCAGICDATEERKMKDNPDKIAKRIRFYSGGVAYKDFIFVQNKFSKFIESAILLNPAGGVSMIFIFNLEKEDDLKIVVSTYDRKWKNLSREKFVLLEKIKKVEQSAIKLTEVDGLKPIALLCEGQFDIFKFENARIVDQLRRGPSEKSLFGWIPNHSENEYDYWSSAIYPSRFGLPQVSGIYTNHSVAIATKLGNDTAIIPMSTDFCFKHYPDWKEAVVHSHTKTINYSGSINLDSKSCMDSEWSTPFKDSTLPFLWIIAAGNSGKENPPFRCPSNLGSQPNKIVVSSAVGSRLTAETDYGIHHADIAVDMSRLGDPATSFAVPVVSRLAAKIAHIYSNLSVPLIRLAILYSATIPKSKNTLNFLNVRSGGILNEYRALEFAKNFSTVPLTEKSMENRIMDLHCPVRSSPCVEIVKEKIRWLKRKDIGLLYEN